MVHRVIARIVQTACITTTFHPYVIPCFKLHLPFMAHVFEYALPRFVFLRYVRTSLGHHHFAFICKKYVNFVMMELKFLSKYSHSKCFVVVTLTSDLLLVALCQLCLTILPLSVLHTLAQKKKKKHCVLHMEIMSYAVCICLKAKNLFASWGFPAVINIREIFKLEIIAVMSAGSSSIHHLNRCQTITLCRGSWPRTPSRLKNEMTRPTTGHEVPLVKPEIRDLQRTPDDRNLHGAFEPP